MAQELDLFLVLGLTCEVWLQYAHAGAEVRHSHWSCRHQKNPSNELISKMNQNDVFDVFCCLKVSMPFKQCWRIILGFFHS